MNQSRALHSSLAMARRVYVIGGSSDGYYIGSIEALLHQSGQPWEQIVTQNPYVAKVNFVVEAINDTEIAVYGGQGGNSYTEYAFILNGKRNKIKVLKHGIESISSVMSTNQLRQDIRLDLMGHLYTIDQNLHRRLQLLQI